MVNLRWYPSTDDREVVSYAVWRDGIQIDTVSAQNSVRGKYYQYNDLGLSVGKTYKYYVIAYDAAGNASNPSNIATIVSSSKGLQAKK